MDNLKQCTKCKEWKPRSEFYKDKKRADGLTFWCKGCTSQARKDHYQKNQSALIQKSRDYYASPEGKEKARIQGRIRHQRHKTEPGYREKKMEWKRRYRERPGVKERENESRKGYTNRPDIRQHRLEYNNQYFSRPDIIEKRREYMNLPSTKKKHRENWRKYHARKLQAPGHHTFDQWEKMCELAEYRCLACGWALRLEADHVAPLTKGGCNCIHNIQPLCRACNSGKNNHHDTDYRTPIILDWLKTIPHSH